MAEIYTERTLNGLTPYDDDAWSALKAWPLGSVIKVKATMARNGQNHKRFMKLLRTVCQNLPEGQEMGVEQLLLELKYDIGHVEAVTRHDPESGARFRKAAGFARDVQANPTADRLEKLCAWLEREATRQATVTHLIPKTIDFSVPEPKFRVFYNQAAEVLTRDYLNASEDEYAAMEGLL